MSSLSDMLIANRPSSYDARLITTSQRKDDGLCFSSPSAKRKKEDLQEQSARNWKRSRVQRGSELRFSGAESKRADIKDLATELHDLIFNHFNIIDVFSLSILYRHCWNIGRKYIRVYFISFVGPMANQSIVCVGSDVTAGDHPPGIFTDARKPNCGGRSTSMGIQ